MAKARRTRTKKTGVFAVGNRYEWVLQRNGVQERGMADTIEEAARARAASELKAPTPREARGDFGPHAREWVEAYSGRTRRGFSEATRLDYRQTLNNYAIPFFDEVRPRKWAQVTRRDVKAFVAWLERGGGHGRTLQARTIDKHLSALHALYGEAIDDGDYTIGTNPVSGVHANPRADEIDVEADDNERRPFSKVQLAAVLTTAGEDRLMYDLLAEIGPRWGELCELRGRDLKATPRGPRLAIRRAWDTKTKRVGRPKGGKVRELPLSPDLARALWRLQRGPDELLFQAPRGGRMSYGNTYRRVLAPLLDDAATEETGDLSWAAFHTFRHTCASLQFGAGRNVKLVCRWLGHHKASYTLDTYIHLMPDDEDAPFSVTAALAVDEGASEGASETPETAQTDTKAAQAKTGDLRA